MELRVSTNWDPALPGMLSNYPVGEVYGKLADDVIGGCRPSFLLPQISRDDVQNHVAACHEAGIKFSYLINTNCLNNVHYTREGYGQIRELLDWLATTGVDRLTIAFPYLINLVKTHYPQFEVKVSSVARINTVTRARQFEDLGVDEIIVDEMLNRDFDTLQAINEAVDVPLEVIANPCCVWECAQQQEHVNHDGHASQTHSHNNYIYLQYPYVMCTRQKLLDPVNIIRARWIRPEDMTHYEDIGITRFKVVERFKTSDALSSAVEAYANRRYEGNLCDLLTLPNQGSFLPPNFEYFNKPDKADMSKVALVADLMNFSFSDALNVRNQDLDGFIDFFKEQDCRRTSCDACGYCDRILDECADWNEERARQQAAKLEELANILLSGALFG